MSCQGGRGTTPVRLPLRCEDTLGPIMRKRISHGAETWHQERYRSCFCTSLRFQSRLYKIRSRRTRDSTMHQTIASNRACRRYSPAAARVCQPVHGRSADPSGPPRHDDIQPKPHDERGPHRKHDDRCRVDAVHGPPVARTWATGSVQVRHQQARLEVVRTVTGGRQGSRHVSSERERERAIG